MTIEVMQWKKARRLAREAQELEQLVDLEAAERASGEPRDNVLEVIAERASELARREVPVEAVASARSKGATTVLGVLERVGGAIEVVDPPVEAAVARDAPTPAVEPEPELLVRAVEPEPLPELAPEPVVSEPAATPPARTTPKPVVGPLVLERTGDRLTLRSLAEPGRRKR